MKASELRKKSVEELSAELNDLLRQQFNLRMQQSDGNVRPSLLHAVRRNIARVKTLLNEKARVAA